MIDSRRNSFIKNAGRLRSQGFTLSLITDKAAQRLSNEALYALGASDQCLWSITKRQYPWYSDIEEL